MRVFVAFKNIVIFVLLLLLSFMVLSAYIKIDPPASVVTTVFRMANQIVLKYLGIGLIVIFLLCSSYLIYQKKHDARVSGWFLFCFLILFFDLAATLTTQIRISNASAAKSAIKYEEISAGQERKDLSGSYACEEKADQYQVSQCSIYSSSDSAYSNVAVIYLNYGGWSMQDESYGTQIYSYCQKEGYTFIRFACERYDGAQIDTLMQENNAALNQLIHNENYTNVFLCGGSAGGHIALLSAFIGEDNALGAETLDTSFLSGVIALYPCVDPGYAYDYYVNADNEKKTILDRLGDQLYCSLYQGTTGTLGGETKKLDDEIFGARDEKSSFYDAVAISSLTTNRETPILIVQGTEDSMIALDSVTSLYDKLKQEGHVAVYLQLPGTEHVFDLFPTLAWDRCEKEMTGFIRSIALQ